MTPEEAPDGTVVIVGHPANGHTATKRNGQWHSSDGGILRDVDGRSMILLYNPKDQR